MSRTFMRALGALLLFGSLFLLPLSASAHEGVEAGNYLLTIGWINEPVIVGQPNGLDLFIVPKESEHTEGETHTEGDAHAADGVTGAEATLKFTVTYGGVSQDYDILPVNGEPGRYRANLLPTREGQFTFKFTGTINGEAVDVTFEPEEVAAAGRLAFPEAVVASADLASQIAALRSQVQTAQIIAIVGALLGLAGLGVGVFSLRKK
jgi:hypothetical protein